MITPRDKYFLLLFREVHGCDLMNKEQVGHLRSLFSTLLVQVLILVKNHVDI